MYGIPSPGCESSDPKVRERNRRYYFNALDKDGEQRIFKIGQQLYDIFLARQQRFYDANPDNKQPLSDRDYLVTRIGSTKNDTKYDPDTGQEYPVDWPEEPFDIRAILQKAFQKAWAHFHAEPVIEPVAPQANFGGGRIPAAKAAAPTPAEANGTAAAAAAAPAEEVEDSLPKTPTVDELEDASTKELKAYLRRPEHNVEFPERAARSRLLELAKKTLEPPF